MLVGSFAGLLVSCPQASGPAAAASNGTLWEAERGDAANPTCPEVGTRMFFYIGFGGAVLDVLIVLVDVLCVRSLFRQKRGR